MDGLERGLEGGANMTWPMGCKVEGGEDFGLLDFALNKWMCDGAIFRNGKMGD